MRRPSSVLLPLVAMAALLSGCGGGAKPVPGATVSKDRTEIDGINLIGVPHVAQGVCAPPVFEIPTPAGLADPDEEAPPVPPPPAAEAQPRPEQSAGPGGPAGARRILVVGDSLLDGLCALGLGDRVVGRVAERAGEGAPNYLGPVIAGLPQPGAVGAVAVDQIKDLHPDLVLARADLADQLGADLGAIAPVQTVAPAGDAGPASMWQRQFLGLGAVFGREAQAQAQAALEEYRTFVREQRQDDTLDPAHTRASLVRFDGGKIALEGPESFAGSVLAELGVDRPPTQRSGADNVIGTDRLRAGALVTSVTEVTRATGSATRTAI